MSDPTLLERAQRALRGEEPWGPIMQAVEAFITGERDAELATLRQKLAEAEKERDEWMDNAGGMVESMAALQAELATAEADCASMREALEHYGNPANWGYKNGALQLNGDRARAALANPQTSAIAARVRLMEETLDAFVNALERIASDKWDQPNCVSIANAVLAVYLAALREFKEKNHG